VGSLPMVGHAAAPHSMRPRCPSRQREAYGFSATCHLDGGGSISCKETWPYASGGVGGVGLVGEPHGSDGEKGGSTMARHTALLALSAVLLVCLTLVLVVRSTHGQEAAGSVRGFPFLHVGQT